MNENYQLLANAIIIQAANDYKKALRILKRYPNNEAALKEVEKDEKFFTSDWYAQLTKVDGKRLMKQIQGEV